MTASPAVSVLIAVHNGLPYLESAVRSIMEQTFRDIEIILVDDASTDASPGVLARLAAEDPRIRVLTLEENHRLPRALNRGLEIARAPYVARMDADDLAWPERIAVQKAYLDAHPEVLLVASSNRRIDGEGKVLKTEIRDLSPELVEWSARFGMPLVHPTFLFRRLRADGTPRRYDPDFPVSQDFDFVVRTLEEGKVASLPDVLLDWRQHGNSISSKGAGHQRALSVGTTGRVQARTLSPARRADAEFIHGVAKKQTPVTVPVALKCFAAFRRIIAEDARGQPALARAMRELAAQKMMVYLGWQGLGERRLLALMALFAPGFRLAWQRRQHRLDGQIRASEAQARTQTGPRPGVRAT